MKKNRFLPRVWRLWIESFFSCTRAYFQLPSASLKTGFFSLAGLIPLFIGIFGGSSGGNLAWAGSTERLLTLQRFLEERITSVVRTFDPQALVFVSLREQQRILPLPGTGYVLRAPVTRNNGKDLVISTIEIKILTSEKTLPKTVLPVIDSLARDFGPKPTIALLPLPGEMKIENRLSQPAPPPAPASLPPPVWAPADFTKPVLSELSKFTEIFEGLFWVALGLIGASTLLFLIQVLNGILTRRALNQLPDRIQEALQNASRPGKTSAQILPFRAQSSSQPFTPQAVPRTAAQPTPVPSRDAQDTQRGTKTRGVF